MSKIIRKMQGMWICTIGIRQFAVIQGGRQTPIWRTAKIFVVFPCTVKQPSAISSAKRCIAVCCISTDGEALRRPLKWKQTSAWVWWRSCSNRLRQPVNGEFFRLPTDGKDLLTSSTSLLTSPPPFHHLFFAIYGQTTYLPSLPTAPGTADGTPLSFAVCLAGRQTTKRPNGHPAVARLHSWAPRVLFANCKQTAKLFSDSQQTAKWMHSFCFICFLLNPCILKNRYIYIYIYIISNNII